MCAHILNLKVCLHKQSVGRRSGKPPAKVARVLLDLFNASEFKRSAVVPQNRLAKDQPERHVVHQRFQRAPLATLSREISVRPRPEATMPIATIVSLHSHPEWIPGPRSLIECDLAGKFGVGVRRARKADPSLAAQCDAKIGAIPQVPRNPVSFRLKRSAAKVLPNFVIGDMKSEWTLSLRAKVQLVQWISFNEGLRFSVPGKPRRPHLHGHAPSLLGASRASRIHEQITEPPRPTIRQSHPQEPYFVAAPRRNGRIHFVQGFDSYCSLRRNHRS